jgi:hypothetical protein
VRLDWLVLSGLDAGRHLVRRRSGTPPRIAGVLPVRDYSDACSVFESLQALSDVTIVLDDNSDARFPYRDRCDEYVALENGGPWDDVANRTTLMHRAFVHGCDWVVCMDDDVVFSHGFQTKDDVLALVETMDRRRADIALFPLRDLWESTRVFRADGIWSRKTFNVLRRNWLFFRSISLREPGRRLHTPLFPRNMRPRRIVAGEHTAYHTGCLTRAARVERVRRYGLEDPGGVFQRDYGYMLDDEGIRLEPVPREDVPLLERKIRLA